MTEVGIVGATGYTGLELVRVLRRHAHVRLKALYSNTTAGERLEDVAPWFGRKESTLLQSLDLNARELPETALLALPSGESMEIANALVKSGRRVIDLSGDFRIKDAELYSMYYSRPHSAQDLLPGAVYGLPEWNREKIANSKLISNPGCYATSIILPLTPLLKQRLIEPQGIVINSMSGLSGAGKKSDLQLSFAEVNETVRAYRVGDHQHIPEIAAALMSLSDTRVDFVFIPHLIPITRGIYTSITVRLAEAVGAAKIHEAFHDAYRDAPFVRLLDDRIPEIKHVQHTNFIDIGFRVLQDGRTMVVMSAIDNLLKGAAGQAVQNLNVMCGYDQEEGLR